MQQTAASSLEPSKLSSDQEIKRQETLATTITVHEEISQAAYLEREQFREQEIKNRRKRHQEAEEQRKQKELMGKAICLEETEPTTKKEKELETETKIQEPSTPQIPSDIHFFFPKRAFQTISKIFANNWKITRPDIENLLSFWAKT